MRGGVLAGPVAHTDAEAAAPVTAAQRHERLKVVRVGGTPPGRRVDLGGVLGGRLPCGLVQRAASLRRRDQRVEARRVGRRMRSCSRIRGGVGKGCGVGSKGAA